MSQPSCFCPAGQQEACLHPAAGSQLPPVQRRAFSGAPERLVAAGSGTAAGPGGVRAGAGCAVDPRRRLLQQVSMAPCTMGS